MVSSLIDEVFDVMLTEASGSTRSPRFLSGELGGGRGTGGGVVPVLESLRQQSARFQSRISKCDTYRGRWQHKISSLLVGRCGKTRRWL